jgi:uncharacterized protein with ParB-like and HNH nuclease domain
MDVSVKLKDDSEVRLKGSKDSKNENRYLFKSSIGELFLTIEFRGSRFDVTFQKDNIGDSDSDLMSKIDEWVVETNPNSQFGTDDNESEFEPVQNPYDPDKIRVDTKPFSLRQIYDMITAGDIDLTPDFQRNLVWDNVRKSRLIESILLRIPLPMFYFAQDDEGRISVVDGLQRLSTIREFMDNEFNLRKLEYLEANCKGKYYSNQDASKAIDGKYFRWFNMTQITVHVIDPSSPFKLKYDIFRRINTGGQPLNAQEIRNCLAGKNLRKALKSMATLDSFKEATGWSVKDVRMEAQELALRFILFHNKFKEDKNLNNYNGNIEGELNLLTEELSKDRKNDYTDYIQLFDNAMRNAFYLFGNYSFRKCRVEHIAPDAKRQLINRALFVSWSVLLSGFKHSDVVKANKGESLAMLAAEKLTIDPALFNFLTYSTNSRVNIQAAFKAAEEVIQKNLKI